MAWFYITPVIYPAQVTWDRIREMFGPERGDLYFNLYMMNPAAAIVVAVRKVVLFGQGVGEVYRDDMYAYLLVCAGISIGLTLTGWLLFRRLSTRFVDEL